MRLCLTLGGSLLLAALGAPTPGLAGPFAGSALCGPAAIGSCASAGRIPGLALPVDWFDDLFGLSLPDGSWRDSCRKARVDGHFLSAECRKKNGGYRDASFDLRRCGGDIANDNGKLVCERRPRGDGANDKAVQHPLAGKD